MPILLPQSVIELKQILVDSPCLNWVWPSAPVGGLSLQDGRLRPPSKFASPPPSCFLLLKIGSPPLKQAWLTGHEQIVTASGFSKESITSVRLPRPILVCLLPLPHGRSWCMQASPACECTFASWSFHVKTNSFLHQYQRLPGQGNKLWLLQVVLKASHYSASIVPVVQ